MSKFIHNRGILKEPTQTIRRAAQPRNFHPKFSPKSSHASQTPNVVSLYVTNINRFLVKFKKTARRVGEFREPDGIVDFAVLSVGRSESTRTAMADKTMIPILAGLCNAEASHLWGIYRPIGL